MKTTLSYKEKQALLKIVKAFSGNKTASEKTLQRLIKIAKDISKKKLERLHQEEGTSMAFITAYRQNLSLKENKKRNNEMLKSFQKSGLKDYYDLDGRYLEEETGKMKGEKTFLLVGPDLKTVMQQADKYEQDSIIFKSKENVVGMYNRLTGDVTIATPMNKEQMSVTDKKVKTKSGDPPPSFEDAWSRFRNIGLSYNFDWDTTFKMNVKNPKPITMKELKSSGFLKKHNLSEKDFKRDESEDVSTYSKKQRDPEGDDHKFYETRVINPDTGRENKLRSLRSAEPGTKAHALFQRLWAQYQKSKKDSDK